MGSMVGHEGTPLCVFCLPPRIVCYSNGFEGFPITVAGPVVCFLPTHPEMHEFPMVSSVSMRYVFFAYFITKGPQNPSTCHVI